MGSPPPLVGHAVYERVKGVGDGREQGVLEPPCGVGVDVPAEARIHGQVRDEAADVPSTVLACHGAVDVYPIMLLQIGPKLALVLCECPGEQC